MTQSVFVYGRVDMHAWAHKKNAFDYTVGPGQAPTIVYFQRGLADFEPVVKAVRID